MSLILPVILKTNKKEPAEVSSSGLGPIKFAGRFVVKCFHKNAELFENFVPCYLGTPFPPYRCSFCISIQMRSWCHLQNGITWIKMEKVLGFEKKLLFKKVSVKNFHVRFL